MPAGPPMRLVTYVLMVTYMFPRLITYIFVSLSISMIIPYQDTSAKIAH